MIRTVINLRDGRAFWEFLLNRIEYISKSTQEQKKFNSIEKFTIEISKL